MRNKYRGTCYRCGKTVEPGDGHFERFEGRWRTQHADCAIELRGTPDPERVAATHRRWARAATLTGKAGQRARRNLREAGNDRGT
jgi:hypothetical protein